MPEKGEFSLFKIIHHVRRCLKGDLDVCSLPLAQTAASPIDKPSGCPILILLFFTIN